MFAQIALIAALLAGPALAVPGGGSWPPPPTYGVNIHPNGNQHKCLDVRGAVYADGTPVDIFDCNGTGAQKWTLTEGNTKVQVAGQPFCLDAGTSPNNNTPMKIWTCYDDLAAQNWYYTNDKRIALSGRGFCLDLTNGDTCNANVIQIYQCTNFNTNQIWTL